MSLGRNRKIGDRTKSGKLKKARSDPRWKTAWTRVRDFGVSPHQALTPMAGYLAGVLFLKGHLNAEHMGRFYSFLQYAPINGRSIPVREKVQGGLANYSHPLNQDWFDITLKLGSEISVLHALADDRLIVSMKRLRQILDMVPMSVSGYAFMINCKQHRLQPVRFHETSKRKIRVFFMGEFVGSYRTMRAAVNAYDRRAGRHFTPG